MQTTIEEFGNYLRLVAEGTWETGYPSLEAFIAAMGVDPDTWHITDGKPNSWPTSGWDNENNQPWTVINHQMRLNLVRKDPKPLHPQIQPVAIRRSARQRRSKPGRIQRQLKTAVFVSDPHFGFARNWRTGELAPFHDRRVLDIALQIMHTVMPDVVIFGGDTLDLPDWSDKFVRSPAMYETTQPAVIEAAWWLAQVRAAVPGADVFVLEGNHDVRMENALLSHLNQAYQLRPADEMTLPAAMSIPRLLALHKLNIEYVGGYPDADLWLSDNLLVTHGEKAKGAPGGTVGALVNQEDVTIIHGHIHRIERASKTVHGRRQRRIIQAICPGCACHIDGRVPGRTAKQNWQQGIAVIRYDDRRHEVAIAAVDEGEALFEGALYQAADRLGELQEATGWPF